MLFSGGKDSRALVELFRPHLGGIVVYHNDTGDLWPETVEYVAAVAATVPHFRRIETDAPAWIEANGLPSPLVHISRSADYARWTRDTVPPVRLSLDCCAANQWRPIADTLAADGITLVLHGQRACDYGTGEPVPWPLPAGISEWPAIASWSDADVFAYLGDQGVTLAPFVGGRAPPGQDCATCPAGWTNRGRSDYLAKHHPALAARYFRHLHQHSVEAAACLRDLAALADELHTLERRFEGDALPQGRDVAA